MLVTCPECGNKVSDSAYSCRKCGYTESRLTWSAGIYKSYKRSANGWSKTLVEAEARQGKEREAIDKQSKDYKTPKQEEREWRDREEGEFEEKAKKILLGVLVIVVVIVVVIVAIIILLLCLP